MSNRDRFDKYYNNLHIFISREVVSTLMDCFMAYKQ